MGLIISLRIKIPSQVHKELQNSITDAVIASHSDKEKKGKKSLGASSSPQPLIVIFPTWTPTSNSASPTLGIT